MLTKNANEHADNAHILGPRVTKLFGNFGRDELKRQEKVKSEADSVVNDRHGRHGALDEDGLVQALAQVNHQYIATYWNPLGIFNKYHVKF